MTAAPAGFSLSLLEQGAERLNSAADKAAIAIVEQALSSAPLERAGVRLCTSLALADTLGPAGSLGRAAADALGVRAKPVRAILFDKSPAMNWALGWHQDRTIVVRERRDVPGFGTWTVKAGMQHVEPPASLLARMVTLRLHLDPVDADNAPLLVAPGSHLLGRISEADIADVVRQRGTVACLAERGDVWIYATLVLHASEAAARPRRRRVLQVDYSADDLPGGLEWLGL